MLEKKKAMYVLVAIGVIVIVLLYLGRSNGRGGNAQDLSIKDIVNTQMEQGNIFKSVGHEGNDYDLDLYVVYFVGRNINKLESEKLTDEITKLKGELLYAEKNNIELSEKELDEELEKTIENLRTSDDYEKYEDEAKKLGTTYDNILRMNRNSYRIVFLRNKIYDKVTSSGKGQDSKKQLWEEFEEKNLEDFKKSSEYKDFQNKLKIFEGLSEKGVKDGDAIKKALGR